MDKQIIRKLICAVRVADRRFDGGTTNHWVRDYLLPALEEQQLVIVEGSDKCDECNGSGVYYIDGEPQDCICKESQE